MRCVRVRASAIAALSATQAEEIAMAMRKKSKAAKSKARRKPVRRAGAMKAKKPARKAAAKRPDPAAALAAFARKMIKMTSDPGADFSTIYAENVVSEEASGQTWHGSLRPRGEGQGLGADAGRAPSGRRGASPSIPAPASSASSGTPA